MIGREGLRRDVLLDVFRQAGAIDPASHLGTGNVSFEVGDDDLAHVTAHVEESLEALLGRPTPLFVRSLGELRALLAADLFGAPPFPEVRDHIVTFFRAQVPEQLDLPIEHADWVVFGRGPGEVVSVTRARDDGRHPGAPGGVIERLAGEPVTSRALSTIERIVAKLP